jgi:hypothetical protein
VGSEDAVDPVEGTEYRPGHVFYSNYEPIFELLDSFYFYHRSRTIPVSTQYSGPPIPSPLRLSDACLDY